MAFRSMCHVVPAASAVVPVLPLLTSVQRHQKAFLSEQCKEIEKNNRMGKTRDLFKKIRDTKGTFHAKMGSIKEIGRAHV